MIGQNVYFTVAIHTKHVGMLSKLNIGKASKILKTFCGNLSSIFHNIAVGQV